MQSCKLANIAIALGMHAEEWKHAYVTPVFNGGEQSEPGIYGLVSLTCVCCKLLEHIIYVSIMIHLRDQHVQLLSENQVERGDRSC